MPTSSDVMIDARGVSKRYRTGRQEPGYRTLRDAIVTAARRPFGGRKSDDERSFWALDDVTFSVAEGETVGLIGRNGAGKSTLLKILSRITWPTSGRAELYGRVGCLLEVGTGFNQELTGRENVFLNGAVLGMTRDEIRSKFDEIVAFSGVERFVDTPVKRYSTGMHMRLAFAVAAHLEPEILFIDEVLAVGDAEFQKRCLNKIQEVGASGRTILFVSHNMETVTRLCDRAILLDAGRVVRDGAPGDVVSAYANEIGGKTAHRTWADPDRAPGDDVARLRAARVVAEGGATLETVDVTRAFGVEIRFDVLAGTNVVVPGLMLVDAKGTCLFWAFEADANGERVRRSVGSHLTTAWVPANLLAEGFVSVGIFLYELNPRSARVAEHDAVSFHAVEVPGRIGARGDFPGHIPGAVRPLLRWTDGGA